MSNYSYLASSADVSRKYASGILYNYMSKHVHCCVSHGTFCTENLPQQKYPISDISLHQFHIIIVKYNIEWAVCSCCLHKVATGHHGDGYYMGGHLGQLITRIMTCSLRSVDHPDIVFNGVVLTESDTHKHLGITLSSNLSWSSHINTIYIRISIANGRCFEEIEI